MKRLLLPLLAFALACQNNPSTPAPATPASSTKLVVAADTPKRLAQMPRTTIDYDRSLLSDSDRAVVAKLIDAAKQIDEIFWRQTSQDNPKWRDQLAKQASASPLDRAGYDYFIANKGPWDRLKSDEPF